MCSRMRLCGENGEGDCGLEERDFELVNSHYAKGEARMVDVSEKPVQWRTAVARGEIRMGPATLKLVRGDKIAKGNDAGHDADCRHSGGETHGGFDSDVSSAAAGSLRGGV